MIHKVGAWFALLVAAPVAMGGVLIGNGGDSMYCMPHGNSPKYPIEGFYVLDYVLRFPADLNQVYPVASLKESMDRIEALLRLKAPVAVASFLSFRATLSPEPFHSTSARKWIPARKNLENIADEYARQLPKNCRFKKPNGNAYYGVYQQTVVRKKVSDAVITYKYDSDIVGDYLTRTDALQASILLIHEWLWDFYEDDHAGAPKIRGANLFLHSKAAETADSAEFEKMVFHSQSEI